MQTREKLTDRFHPHATLEAKGIQRGHHEASEPLAAFLRFPQPGFWMAVPALHRLRVTMDTALGKPGLMGKLPNTLLAVFTKTGENPKAFVPKSPVEGGCETFGQSSGGWLNSCRNSAPQHT